MTGVNTCPSITAVGYWARIFHLLLLAKYQTKKFSPATSGYSLKASPPRRSQKLNCAANFPAKLTVGLSIVTSSHRVNMARVGLGRGFA